MSDVRAAVVQALVVLSFCLLLIGLAARRPRAAETLAIVIVSLDLMAAGSRIVWAVPQAVFEEPPRMFKLIEASERSEPAPGPFRVHRMNLWQPVDWFLRSSNQRHEEIARWQHDTLDTLTPVSFGLDSTYLLGPSDVYDHALLFMPGLRIADPEIARTAKLQPGEPYMYYPRQSFDVWNTRLLHRPGQAAGNRHVSRLRVFLAANEDSLSRHEILRGGRSRAVHGNTGTLPMTSAFCATRPRFRGPGSFTGPGSYGRSWA